MKEEYKTEEFRKKLRDRDIKMVCVGERDYPEKLIPFDHKPYFLFYKGKLPDENATAVAMVGARACSNYGRTMAKKIAGELAYNNVQIISGMARGIDTYSQLGAVEAGGATFAVLGCGVDICYPTENIELYENIIKTGGIISEYPPGDKPLAWHFPMRNRIISGLSDKVDVMAVPGRVDDKLSEGCNRLIRSGAGLVRGAKDILEELKYEVFNKEKENAIKEKILEKDFLLLYSELGLQPKSIDELMEKTGIEYGILADMLLQLQLRGLVEQPSDNYYSRLE